MRIYLFLLQSKTEWALVYSPETCCLHHQITVHTVPYDLSRHQSIFQLHPRPLPPRLHRNHPWPLPPRLNRYHCRPLPPRPTATPTLKGINSIMALSIVKINSSLLRSSLLCIKQIRGCSINNAVLNSLCQSLLIDFPPEPLKFCHA